MIWLQNMPEEDLWERDPLILSLSHPPLVPHQERVRAFSAFFASRSQRARIQRVNRLKGESFFNNKFPRGIRELLYKYDFKRRYNTPHSFLHFRLRHLRESQRELGCAPSSSTKDIGSITLSTADHTHNHRQQHGKQPPLTSPLCQKYK